MQPLLHILDVVLPLLYAGVTALYLQQFIKDRAAFFSARYILYGVIGLHVAYFVLRTIEFSYFPFGTKPEFLSFVALSIAAVYAFIERQQKQSRTGIFFATIALIFQLPASVFMDYSGKHPILLENPTYAIHVVFLILGLTALATGALYALMYVILSRQLKNRALGMFFKRLPPLASLERMSRIGTVAGTVLLGAGLGMGYLLALDLPGFNLFDPKFLIADGVWLGYAAGIVFARSRGLSGLQSAYLSLLWFAVFLASVAVANHSFQS